MARLLTPCAGDGGGVAEAVLADPPATDFSPKVPQLDWYGVPGPARLPQPPATGESGSVAWLSCPPVTEAALPVAALLSPRREILKK